MDSSSKSGPTVDERQDTLEHALDRLNIQVNNQDQGIQDSKSAGEQCWNQLNEDVKKLRPEILASIENLEDFKEEMRTDPKDIANAQGDFGQQLSD